jgi:hypothetical protein
MTTETTVQRLQELLEVKDEQLQAQRDELATLERQLRFGVDWMLHSLVKAERDALPSPRIEMAITQNTSRYQEVQVSLVLPQLDSTVVRVPLSYSKRSGSALDPQSFPSVGELSSEQIGALPGLVNHACFFMDKTGIPAYIVLGAGRVYEVTSLRPLKLSAIG